MGNKTNGEAVRFDIAKMNELLRPFGIKSARLWTTQKLLTHGFWLTNAGVTPYRSSKHQVLKKAMLLKNQRKYERIY